MYGEEEVHGFCYRLFTSMCWRVALINIQTYNVYDVNGTFQGFAVIQLYRDREYGEHKVAFSRILCLPSCHSCVGTCTRVMTWKIGYFLRKPLKDAH